VSTPYSIWIENTYTLEFTFHVRDLVKRLYMVSSHYVLIYYATQHDLLLSQTSCKSEGICT